MYCVLAVHDLHEVGKSKKKAASTVIELEIF